MSARPVAVMNLSSHSLQNESFPHTELLDITSECSSQPKAKTCDSHISDASISLRFAKTQKISTYRTIIEFILIVLYNTVMPGFEIATVSFIAYWTQMPFIFPSLGPEAFLHFAVPDRLPASPRNSILGHFLGCLWGYIGLMIADIGDEPSVFTTDVTLPRIGAVSFAIALTCGTMILFNCSHPPAGATTLIVSLGIMPSLLDIGVLMLSVTILCVETWIITKIFRSDVEYPYWSHDHCNIQKNKNNNKIIFQQPALARKMTAQSRLTSKLDLVPNTPLTPYSPVRYNYN